MAEISYALIHSVQHLYFIVAAPALWLPLGLVILGSQVLPRILGYLALVLAAGYALAGRRAGCQAAAAGSWPASPAPMPAHFENGYRR